MKMTNAVDIIREAVDTLNKEIYLYLRNGDTLILNPEQGQIKLEVDYVIYLESDRQVFIPYKSIDYITVLPLS